MNQINLSGNVLLGHGFRYLEHSYSLILPVADEHFMLDWDSSTGLYLCLVEERDLEGLPKNLQVLHHIKTLEMLQHLYFALTNQPLIEIPEEAYRQQVMIRTRETNRDDIGTAEYTAEFDGSIELLKVFKTKITPENLKKEGFAYKCRRYKVSLNSEGYQDGQYNGTSTDLIWEEDEGLGMEFYEDYVCIGTFFLGHIQTMEALKNLKTLLTPKVEKEDLEWDTNIFSIDN